MHPSSHKNNHESNHKINHSAIVNYSCHAMYELVNNISEYPEFVPYCSEVKIYEKNAHSQKASISLKKGPFSHSFTTQNTCTAPHKIHMELVEGPFSFFEGCWKFEPLGENNQACKVSVNLQFEIKNTLLNKAFGKLFDTVAHRMLDAFCQRADQIHRE